MVKLKDLLNEVLTEGTCGYGIDGELGDEPAGPHLYKHIKKLKEIDYQAKLSRGHKPDYYQLGTSEFKPFDKSRDEDVEENFADGKKPGRKGISKRVGIPKKATLTQLAKLAKAKGEKGRMARWQLNMRRGRKKAAKKK